MANRIDDDLLEFIEQDRLLAFCTGTSTKNHAVAPVFLRLRRSGLVRRGVCSQCGTVFVSTVEETKGIGGGEAHV